MITWKSDNFEIAYQVIENSAPYDLVILNGNLATSRWWYPSIEFARTHWPNKNLTGKLVFLELPGCGASPAVQEKFEFSKLVQTYSEILIQLKLKSNSRIMGHSTGGLIACHLMAQNQLTFEKALLLDPVGPHGIQFDDLVLEKYEEMKSNQDLTAAIIGFTIHGNDFQSDFFKNVIVADTFQSVQKTGSLMIQALRGLDSTSIYPLIKTPITVLFGDQDILLPRKDAEEIVSLVQGSKFILIEGAGHCLNVENPSKMGQLIHQYLS